MHSSTKENYLEVLFHLSEKMELGWEKKHEITEPDGTY